VAPLGSEYRLGHAHLQGRVLVFVRVRFDRLRSLFAARAERAVCCQRGPGAHDGRQRHPRSEFGRAQRRRKGLERRARLGGRRELDSHLHLGEPGRFPLKISGDRLPSGLKLVKATEPVKLSEPPKSKKDAVLVVTEIDVQGDRATVRYRYDVEGIRATVTLAKTAHGWELKNSRLVEH
jgi:hypothetical protein